MINFFLLLVVIAVHRMAAWPSRPRHSNGIRTTACQLKISSASKRAATTTITVLFLCPRRRGKQVSLAATHLGTISAQINNNTRLLALVSLLLLYFFNLGGRLLAVVGYSTTRRVNVTIK